MFLNLLEQIRIQELKKEFITANDLKVNYCVKCGFCCNKRPCIPTYKEFMRLCNFLNLSVKETIQKYFCIDVNNFSDCYYPKPAGINQLDLLGKFIPLVRTFNEGKCIFLSDDNLCKIYKVKFKSAEIYECWKNNDNSKYTQILNKSWFNHRLQDIYDFEGE